MKHLLPCFAVIAALGITTAAHAADVGRVLLAAGDTFAIRGNQTIKLAYGTTIQDKDVLRTGSASNLQVRFIDESIVSMKEASELRIDEFQFSGKEDGKERGFFSLLKGGLRTVTGLVGRSNNASYRLSTVTATIGIRGTDYAATLCQGDCRNNDGSLAKDGLYGRTHGISHGTNRIDVSNERDQKSFGINENFYVADAKSIVEPLLVAPDFVSNKLEGRKQGGGKGESGGSGSEQATTGGAAAESRPSTTPEPLPQLQFVATQDLGPQGTPAVLLAPANGFALVSPVGGAFFDVDDLTATYNSLNQLTAYSGTATAGSLNAGTITDAGGLTLANGQIITWGRWTGDTLVQAGTGGMVAGSPLLFITASGVGNDDIGLGGVATYTYAGGPNPVDAGGNVGSITSTSATMNFTTQTATLAVATNFPSILVAGSNTGPASFNVSGSGVRSIGTTGGDWVGGLSGTCTGSGCIGGASGAASGYFLGGTTGPNGYEFAVFDGSLGVTNAGAAVFLNAYLSSSFTPGPPPATSKEFQFVFTDTPGSIGSGRGSAFTVSPPLLTSYSLTPPSGPQSGSLNSGTVVESTSATSTPVQANAAAAGNIQWGRWTGAFQVVNGGVTLTPGSGLHYIYGDMAGPLPTTSSATYNYIGGTNPTNSSGQVGAFTGGAFNVNFVTQTLSIATPLTFTMPGGGGVLNYSLTTCTSCTYSSPTASFISNPATLSGTCTGGVCSAGFAATGILNGGFTGATGQGLITSSGISTAGGVAPVTTFTAAFMR